MSDTLPMPAPPVQHPGPHTTLLTAPLQAPCLAFTGTDAAQAALMDALAKARLEFGPVVRDRTGQYGNQRFPYATLGSLTDATAKPLATHGVVVMNFFTSAPTEGKHRLTTVVSGHGARILAHLDFQPREARDEGEGQRKTEWIKEYGKLQTYLVRYQYKALFSLDSEPDADDAPIGDDRDHGPRRDAPRPEQQQRPQSQPQPRPQPQPERSATITVVPNPKPAPVAPVPAKPAAPVEPDEVADQDLRTQVLALKDQLQIGKIQFNALCDAAGRTPSTLFVSSKATYAVMCELQKIALKKGAA